MRDAGPERVERPPSVSQVSAGAVAGVVGGVVALGEPLGERRVRRIVFRVGHTRRARRAAVA